MTRTAAQARAAQQAARAIIEAGGELQVLLPVPPKTLHPNGRAPWAAKMRERKNYREQAAGTAAAQVLERYGYRPRFAETVIELFYNLPWPRNGQRQPHDPDNLIAWAKTAIDALQDAGVLSDDRHAIYLPPHQEWLESGSVQPANLHVVVRKWQGGCPICGRAPA